MKQRAKWVWGSIICGLLFGSVGLQLVMVMLAVNNPSFAVVPDYERKANEWDSIRAEQTASDALGWTVDVRFQSTLEPGQAALEIVVFDRFGKPIRDARVRVEGFHLARAADVTRAAARHQEDGRYRAVVAAVRSGVWEWAVVVERADDRFLGKVRRRIAIAPRVG